jgi:hypothetical protein
MVKSRPTVSEIRDWCVAGFIFKHQTLAALARYLAARCAAQNAAVG